MPDGFGAEKCPFWHRFLPGATFGAGKHSFWHRIAAFLFPTAIPIPAISYSSVRKRTLFFCACTDTQPVSFVAAMLQKERAKVKARQRNCAATGIQQDNLKLKSNGQRDKPGGKAKGAKETVAQMGNCGSGIGCGDVGGGRVFAEECGWEASGVL